MRSLQRSPLFPAAAERTGACGRASGGDASVLRLRPRDARRHVAGRFGSDELAHDLQIGVEDGHLVAGPVGGAPRRTPFTPLARDLFATDDVGWRFERDARGKVVRLVASTDRARGVILTRR